jgi:hypothetical protein
MVFWAHKLEVPPYRRMSSSSLMKRISYHNARNFVSSYYLSTQLRNMIALGLKPD